VSLRDRILRKHGAYVRTFAGQDGAIVLADLARFCHAQKTTHIPGDPYGSAQLEGRRQVLLRIVETTGMSDAEMRARLKAIEEGDEE